MTYPRTNGYLLETSESSILIDPYFSRIALAPVVSNSAIKPDIARINSGLHRLPKRIDAILATTVTSITCSMYPKLRAVPGHPSSLRRRVAIYPKSLAYPPRRPFQFGPATPYTLEPPTFMFSRRCTIAFSAMPFPGCGPRSRRGRRGDHPIGSVASHSPS